MSTHRPCSEENRKTPKMLIESLNRCANKDLCVGCIYQDIAEAREHIGYGDECIDLLMQDTIEVLRAMSKRISQLEAQVSHYKEKQ